MKIEIYEMHVSTYRVDVQEVLEALEIVRSGNARASTQRFQSCPDDHRALVTDKHGNETGWTYVWSREEQKFIWQKI